MEQVVDGAVARVPLVLSESDLGPTAQGALQSHQEGSRVLGQGDARRVLFDALPAAIARRFEKILPDGFELREVEMNVSLEGTVFGFGVSGDVTVKFGPARKE